MVNLPNKKIIFRRKLPVRFFGSEGIYIKGVFGLTQRGGQEQSQPLFFALFYMTLDAIDVYDQKTVVFAIHWALHGCAAFLPPQVY